MREILKKLGMTREEFAAAFGAKVSTVHFWCDKDAPTAKDMKRIARWLGWSVEQVQEYIGR